jgi:hypothetical protein
MDEATVRSGAHRSRRLRAHRRGGPDPQRRSPAPKQKRKPYPHPDALAVLALSLHLEPLSQVRWKGAPGRGIRIAADRLGTRRHPGCISGKPTRLAGEHELPDDQGDQERRGQRAEELDAGLSALGVRSLRSWLSHPCLRPS